MNKPSGQKPGPTGNDWEDDDGPWRHPPVAPRDAGIADSLGKAVSDVVTGPLEGDPAKAKPPAPKPPKPPAKP
ncbi:MAG: hypothetical protein K8R60_06115 [Burkholderiales bacterium]|nr:hypothetical protein [Burkholderiales bacterium]